MRVLMAFGVIAVIVIAAVGTSVILGMRLGPAVPLVTGPGQLYWVGKQQSYRSGPNANDAVTAQPGYTLVVVDVLGPSHESMWAVMSLCGNKDRPGVTIKDSRGT